LWRKPSRSILKLKNTKIKKIKKNSEESMLSPMINLAYLLISAMQSENSILSFWSELKNGQNQPFQQAYFYPTKQSYASLNYSFFWNFNDLGLLKIS
jgi:hypothetical protein